MLRADNGSDRMLTVLKLDASQFPIL